MQTVEFDKSIGKEALYLQLIPQMQHLLEGEKDLIANSANFCAVLKEAFNWWWIGFYFVKDQQLVLGPFQGPLACTRINFGKGVCGSAWEQKQTLVVPDVEAFPGHIACSAASRSEIVLPVFNSKKEVIGVLDIDSEHLNSFDELDARYLQKLLAFLPIPD